MRIGDTFTILRPDGSAVTINRTPQTYAQDLADAYNTSMSDEAKARGMEWFVTPAGELKLGDNAAWSRANAKRDESRRETERARHLRHELDQSPW